MEGIGGCYVIGGFDGIDGASGMGDGGDLGVGIDLREVGYVWDGSLGSR